MQTHTYFVEIPNFEHCFAIMQGVLEQAVSGGERVALTAQNRAIRQGEGLEKLKVVLSNTIRNVNGAAGDGSGGSVELGARVSGLEHVPVRVNEISHPQAVVGTMHHVTPLEPIGSVHIS